MPEFKPITIEEGTVIGKWIVLDKVIYVGGRLKWLCKCTCGVTRYVLLANLERGGSKSCGKCHWFLGLTPEEVDRRLEKLNRYPAK